MKIDLSGKVAVVTGGSGDLGRYICRSLGVCGASVAVHYNNNADKAEELKSFIARFSANASKSRQASSRQKQLEKLDLSDMPVSTRRRR